MIIKRVDDKTVKCFLTNEELEAYNIDYKDFILRSEKAKEVVQEIIVQAEEEVGYKPPRFAFDLQIVMVPDQGLELIFSEKDPLMEEQNGQQLIECLKEMKQALQQKREKLTAEQAQGQEKSPQPQQKKAPSKPEVAVFAFDSLHHVMEFAEVLPKTLRVNSRLWVLDGTYFLYMDKGTASYERYSRACVQALEFGSLYAAEEDRIQYLYEHGECMITEKALKKLRLS